MVPLLLLVIVVLAGFLGRAAWSARASSQPASSINTFTRALEALDPTDGREASSPRDPKGDDG